MCPYYLDGDLIFEKIGDTRFIGYCAVFKVRGEAVRLPTARGKPSEPPADAGLSKLNSMWAAPLEPEAQGVLPASFGRHS